MKRRDFRFGCHLINTRCSGLKCSSLCIKSFGDLRDSPYIYVLICLLRLKIPLSRSISVNNPCYENATCVNFEQKV